MPLPPRCREAITSRRHADDRRRVDGRSAGSL